MKANHKKEVYDFLLTVLADQLQNCQLSPSAVTDELDLIDSGVIDSMGFIDLIAAVEEQFRISINFGNLAPSECTKLGIFTDCVAKNLQQQAPDNDR